MLRQLLTILATALFMGAVSASAQAPGDAQRIVAVGDLHGDLPAWEAIATAAGLVDTQGEWAGGETVLVQLGDVTDRGPDSLAIIERLRALQRQAPGAGGKVVLLIGNHEAMNVTGDLRYVHPGEYAAFVDRSRLHAAKPFGERTSSASSIFTGAMIPTFPFRRYASCGSRRTRPAFSNIGRHGGPMANWAAGPHRFRPR